ncbi:MAG: DUF418 domain-containing protein [Pelagimonas sp.]|jgi:uncharacterized membrane protein YeiB|nr:DUF418 domain-containing protein [Pelagimonas sp.]
MRLIGLDIARFLAFFGMVLVNFRIAAEVAPGSGAVSILTNAMEGRAAALFVVLAGIGMSLAQPGSLTVLKRAAFLFVVGLINLMIFDADILHYYALYFLCALPVLTLSARALFWLGGCLSVGSLALHLGFSYDQGWDWDTLTYADFWTLPGFVRHSLFNGWHPVFPWMAFMLIGMGLGKLDLRADHRPRQFITIGLALTLGGLIPGWFAPAGDLQDLLNTAPIPPGPFYILSATGSAMVVLGLILALTRGDTGRWARVLATGGRQSLTLYLAHILLGMGLLEGLGLLNGALTATQIFLYSLAFCGLCLIYTWAWSRRFSRGPLEAMMRKLAG